MKVARYLMDKRIDGTTRERLMAISVDKSVPAEVRNAIREMSRNRSLEAIDTLGTRTASDGRILTSQFETAAQINGYRLY